MKQQTIHLLKSCLLVVLVLLLTGLSTVCKSKEEEVPAQPAAQPQMETAEAPGYFAGLRSILGEAKEDYPGVEDIKLEESEPTVFYRFIPEDISTLQEELGEDLAPKIRKIYETESAVNVLHFVVMIPFTEETGGSSFKRQLSFTMTKKIFNETDWTGLFDRDFLKIVENLKAWE